MRAVHDRPKPDKSWDPYPVTVHTSADPAVLAATLRATWPDGVCTDTGVYYQAKVEMPLLAMYTRGVRFVTGRVNARAVIPAFSNCSLRLATSRRPSTGSCRGRTPLGLAGDDRQDRLHPVAPALIAT